MSEPGTATVLEVEVSKVYGGRTVLDRARLEVRPATVHALVGENGAGKSTLVNIAAGRVRPDGGTVRAAAPIGLVPQHGALVPTLTVVENAVLGREPTRAGVLALGPVAGELRAIGERHGLAIDPDARAGALSVGEQQRAEIVIALWRGARLLVLDEPTAVLAPVEVAGLFEILRAHVAGGGAAVLVTHKLDEVIDIADDVTVLRAGKVVETHRGRGFTAAAIARAMIGTDPPERLAPPAPPGDEVVLEARGLALGPLRGVALAVRAGEIVGVAGVEGNGQRELAQAIAGLARPEAGAIRVGGRDVTADKVAARQAAGLAHLPDDRHGLGLELDATVEENLALGRERELGRGPARLLVDRPRRRAHAEALVRDFDVRPPDIGLPVRALSGGNQQKLMVARELTRPGLRALLAAQPTRGVDVAAQALIHERLRAAAGQGLGLLVVSADLDELLGLCHRVVVLHRGRIAGEVGGDELRAAGARDRIGAMMTGVGP